MHASFEKIIPPIGSIYSMGANGPILDTAEQQNDRIWLRVLLTAVASSFTIGACSVWLALHG